MRPERADDRRLAMEIVHLEMHAPPAGDPLPAPPGVAVRRIAEPAVASYRELYRRVGEPWIWYERRLLDDAALAAVIGNPAVEIHVLERDGAAAGYAELDRRMPGDVELAYFGLVPEAIGHGLGGFLLDFAIRRAWEGATRRVWVHTCNFDHPAALGLYQRHGFRIFDRERCMVDDPRRPGAMPPGREFAVEP